MAGSSIYPCRVDLGLGFPLLRSCYVPFPFPFCSLLRQIATLCGLFDGVAICRGLQRYLGANLW